mmetsp:Transcript_42513/g.74617  ORF Transcript_42513/g.74617 Transcript_42513/m.74617 type:complete len:433 (-) Transcript_42513:474-1772(-)
MLISSRLSIVGASVLLAMSRRALLTPARFSDGMTPRTRSGAPSSFALRTRSGACPIGGDVSTLPRGDCNVPWSVRADFGTVFLATSVPAAFPVLAFTKSAARKRLRPPGSPSDAMPSMSISSGYPTSSLPKCKAAPKMGAAASWRRGTTETPSRPSPRYVAAPELAGPGDGLAHQPAAGGTPTAPLAPGTPCSGVPGEIPAATSLRWPWSHPSLSEVIVDPAPAMGEAVRPSDRHTDWPSRGKRCAPFTERDGDELLLPLVADLEPLDAPSMRFASSRLWLRRTASAEASRSVATAVMEVLPPVVLRCEPSPRFRGELWSTTAFRKASKNGGCHSNPRRNCRSNSKAFVKTRAFTCGSTPTPCQTKTAYRIGGPAPSSPQTFDCETTSMARPLGVQDTLALAASSSSVAAAAALSTGSSVPAPFSVCMCSMR